MRELPEFTSEDFSDVAEQLRVANRGQVLFITSKYLPLIITALDIAADLTQIPPEKDVDIS